MGLPEKYYPLPRKSVLPSFFMQRLQDFLAGAETNLRLSLKNSTTVQVVPDAELGIAAIDLAGQWRWIETTVSRAHPGGAKGTYTVWAVGTDLDVDNVPDPFTDHTNYAFDLRITAGENPSGAGVEVFEKIGEIDWSGTEIETIRQTHGSVTGPMLAEGALSKSSGNIDWTRDASGAMVASYKAASVSTAALIDLCVTTAKVAANAITEGKLGLLSVSTAVIQDLAVSTAKLAAKAVTEGKLGDESVNTGQLKKLGVTSAILAAEAVTGEKVASGAITEAKLAAEAVGTGKIANLAVTEGKLANLAVGTGKLANLAVTTAKLAELAITEAKIADGAVTDKKLAKPFAYGLISGGGSKLVGSGFTASRTSKGLYKVTFTEITNAIPIVIPVSNTLLIARVLVSETFFTVQIEKKDETPEDSEFSFMAKGI